MVFSSIERENGYGVSLIILRVWLVFIGFLIRIKVYFLFLIVKVFWWLKMVWFLLNLFLIWFGFILKYLVIDIVVKVL